MLKKFTGEPWPFDRHLVVLQRFDGRQPIKELDFKYCAFGSRSMSSNLSS